MIFPHPYVIGAAVLLIASAYGLGRFHGASAVREDFEHEKAQAVAKAAVEAAAAARKDVQVVTEYVDREKVIERNVPVIRERLVRVCNDKPANRAGVSGPTGNPHAPAGPHADRGSDNGSAALAADLIECRASAERLRALQAWVMNNQAGG